MIHKIRKPILHDLERYHEVFNRTMRADNALLSAILQHIASKTGKLMRPSLVLLCARTGGVVDEAVLHAAVGLELLHTASLVHDDVVDESTLRRGQRSVNAVWDNKAAVLVGDYITSSVLAHIAVSQRVDVVERIADLGMTLADGELQQLNNRGMKTFSKESYYDVITKKTASLFAVCAWVGATLGGASEMICQELERYGLLVGRCFQIRDDIFDFEEHLDVGKPKGNDMVEGKLTLPILHVLNILEGQEQEFYHQIALKVRRQEATKLEIQQLVALAQERGGVTYAYEEMARMRKEVMEILKTMNNSEVAEALEAYFDYVTARKV